LEQSLLNDFEGVFDVLFEHSPIPMWVLDSSRLDFLAVNDAACTLYGYRREEFLQKNAFDLRLQIDSSTYLENVLNFSESGQVERSRMHRVASGDKIRVLTFSRRIIYKSVPSILVWSVDVTQREQSSVELQSTRIFLDAVVESIPSMVFVKDAQDGRFILLNKAGEELLGLSRHDLIGKTDFDLFDPKDAARFREADQAVVASGKLVTIENEPLVTPEGIRSLRTQKVGVPDVDGKPRYLLGISEDVTEKLRAEELSRYLALHDVLTDLPNRLSFHNTLDNHLIENEKNNSDFALLLLDLDFFKSVNDNLGHHAGDELLRQLAARLRSLVTDSDIVARLGGDEFGVLHCGLVDQASASELANDVIISLSEPFVVDGHSVTIGCSAGIAMKSLHGTSTDALMKRADLALYAAKASGKGRHVWFDFEMEEKADRQRIFRDELSHALGAGQLFIEYQPIIDTVGGRIVCCEALLRWRHPDRGLISPAEFIPVAEASGQIERIGRWVLEQACAVAATWPHDVGIAVNLSPQQFNGFNLALDVTRALARGRLSPDRLELEVTESVLLTDSLENLRILNELKQLGVRIALDDFGTGYSSLSYLRRFAFDKLKIDRSFITDLTSSPENLAIVRAIIGLGKSFGATVTAEGVETDPQFQCLLDEGCGQVQGYLTGRPMSEHAIAEILNESSQCREAE